MSIKAVIFDLDDTLYGDFKTCNQLGLEACAAYAEKHCGVSGEVFLKAVLESKKALQKRLFRFLLHVAAKQHGKITVTEKENDGSVIFRRKTLRRRKHFERHFSVNCYLAGRYRSRLLRHRIICGTDNFPNRHTL